MLTCAVVSDNDRARNLEKMGGGVPGYEPKPRQGAGKKTLYTPRAVRP